MPKLLIDESPLQVQPTLATWVGLNEALILQQLNYWFNKKGKLLGQTDENGIRWIRMTLPEWCNNFSFFDEGQIRRALTNLLEDGLLLRRQFTGRSFWYRINHDLLDALTGPVERKSSLLQKRQDAANLALDKRLSEQSVQIQNDDKNTEKQEIVCTKCSDTSEHLVQTICTKCSASKTTTKTTSKILSSNEDNVAKPPTPNSKSPPDQNNELLPDTPECQFVFLKINEQRNAQQRRNIKKFQTLEQKRQCIQAVQRLGMEESEKCLKYWFATGIVSIGQLIPKMNKWRKNGVSNGTHKQTGRSSQKRSGNDNKLSEQTRAAIRRITGG
jgi:hypothetical protein